MCYVQSKNIGPLSSGTSKRRKRQLSVRCSSRKTGVLRRRNWPRRMCKTWWKKSNEKPGHSHSLKRKLEWIFFYSVWIDFKKNMIWFSQFTHIQKRWTMRVKALYYVPICAWTWTLIFLRMNARWSTGRCCTKHLNGNEADIGGRKQPQGCLLTMSRFQHPTSRRLKRKSELKNWGASTRWVVQIWRRETDEKASLDHLQHPESGGNIRIGWNTFYVQSTKRATCWNVATTTVSPSPISPVRFSPRSFAIITFCSIVRASKLRRIYVSSQYHGPDRN